MKEMCKNVFLGPNEAFAKYQNYVTINVFILMFADKIKYPIK